MSNDGSDADREANRLSRRVRRYAATSTSLGGLAAKTAMKRALGRKVDNRALAAELAAALGGLKGPVMKLAQLLAAVPDALPPEFAEEFATLQAHAPPMGWPFVRRRMAAELGPDWRAKFKTFEEEAAHAASLGQVHRATDMSGRALACKLQYPDMASAVEADLRQLDLVLGLYRRLDRAIDTSEIKGEVGARLREELDYALEAQHMALYRAMLSGGGVNVPEAVPALSTPRLLTMSWLTGAPMLSFKSAPQDLRNRIATHLFEAWWLPFARYGVIHGDPHPGNYSVTPEGALNLLDFGCVRSFPPRFVSGVIALYRGLESGDRDAQATAYEIWGFKSLSPELIDTLNIWARFIYGPLLDDRVRTVADGISPAQYGRKEAFEVHKRLRTLGPVKPPREFVFMDRAAIGLGSVFLHLNAELNFYRLFNEAITGFSEAALAKRQKAAFKAAGVPLPA